MCIIIEIDKIEQNLLNDLGDVSGFHRAVCLLVILTSSNSRKKCWLSRNWLSECVFIMVSVCLCVAAGVRHNSWWEAADWSMYLHSATAQNPCRLPAKCRGGGGVHSTGFQVSSASRLPLGWLFSTAKLDLSSWPLLSLNMPVMSAEVNSAFYPQQDGKWVVAYGLVTYWSDGMSASCRLWVQLFTDVGSGWPPSALWYH